ncbi:MAG TPA: carbamoyltransferase C-terminal domain-containing protein [Acidimicrobiales bacterium]|jgi:carbamoyltransferase|nr:carbamoyltransferase C-terminal domain-containing protein [Acidimicrobiales bacterium]
MAVVLGLNAVFHDPAAAVVVDGRVVAAAEEERFSRRKHGKRAVPFSTWELPEASAGWCLEKAGLSESDVDAVTYSYDPWLVDDHGVDATAGPITRDDWEALRTLYARMAPSFIRSALPGIEEERVGFVAHHVAHAASAYLAAPYPDSSVLVLDGRGETASHLAGRSVAGDLEVFCAQQLPHSLGLMYEDLTSHLGFLRSSDEYKVMAMAAYAEPKWLPEFQDLIRVTEDGGFVVEPIDWASFVAARHDGDDWSLDHAALASSVQTRLEEVIVALARWLHDRTGDRVLTMAGGVALNCVANTRLAVEGPFDEVWVQPAAGDAGTALGAAMWQAHRMGDRVEAMTTPALGRGWDDADLELCLMDARLAYERPADLADTVAEVLAGHGVVAWYQGRSEYGPRALGHRSLLANPARRDTLRKLNDIKGREQFRPVAPMVMAERAADVFDGPLPSPFMLFTHQVRPGWAERIPAVVHVDGSARVQTVDAAAEPLVHRLLSAFERRTGLPVVVNTSLNTVGRPIVDHPRDALECFGSTPVDMLVLGPFVLRRPAAGVA